ncbi:Asp-tRNA(Asn)/Glu-tRNA(Gln) amidotransferase subunit GatB [Mucilaginibacter polytrichastri]|uniref:Aspartyl/glutamyl-tRNA(Asn/Gln) amidotransferase subunit B n=1 Tax=Mucilaginibacter polytrichastri TaxID=1302689 RepID=A0A1Q5ZX84_9SPHI|nr:Asp-tRNA(Asn)/Glu-tRNA(Gln) amidotransferase subunit GatB [Mucilaginibacter polytrichastri]OKS86338.1 Aspartyl/glutamyl-tRNA(Asn/Gln) amidotransferase subunit B [Mucilaginibacter polytrichastri]SFT21121.1 aspartyl/glutamyl-tRNA(Asn/Gln) amidotransferase subunit B [Mucilaginibacter polytrichastri]
MTEISDRVIEQYELVIGLEVHAQLSTQSKAFCSDSAAFGALPNHHVSMVSIGHPGTLPFANERMVEYAVKMGLACGCEINPYNTFARKNYFYADSPRGYQITQDQQPICIGGRVVVRLSDGTEKAIAIHHIHMEDDAGKSIHDQDDKNSLIDLNRAGVPLLEIVSEPDMRSGEEAAQYLSEIRKLVRYLDICDGNMEEGSLRCDVNISVRKKGATEYGNRCEVKNLNSLRNVQRAIEHEFLRQITVIENGGHIDQNTLNFNADTGETSVLRSKEMANDYRYFPEPDLVPVSISPEYIAHIKAGMTALPSELYHKYISDLGLTDYDASVLTSDKELALFFEQLILHTTNYKSAANWMMGPVKSYLNEHSSTLIESGLNPQDLADVIALVDGGKINNSVAAQKLFPTLLKHSGKKVAELAEQLNLLISENSDDLQQFIQEALQKHPDKVKEYKKGKKGVLGLFMGEIMKRSKGKIDPQKTNQLLLKALENA